MRILYKALIPALLLVEAVAASPSRADFNSIARDCANYSMGSWGPGGNAESCQIMQQYENAVAACQQGNQRGCDTADAMIKKYDSNSPWYMPGNVIRRTNEEFQLINRLQEECDAGDCRGWSAYQACSAARGRAIDMQSGMCKGDSRYCGGGGLPSCDPKQFLNGGR